MADKSVSSSSSGGIVLFIGLKLTNYIDWSWWWVLSPLWLPLAIILVLVVAIGMMVSK